MSKDFHPALSTTGVGSLPFAGVEEAVSSVLDADLTIPFWPQLPKRCFGEEMVSQYGQGVPCVRIDPDQKTISIDPSRKFEELEDFYNRFLEEDPSLFAMSEDVAAGLYAFEAVAARQKWSYVKGQTTGPVTLTTGIFGADKRPLFADPDLRDAAVKTIVRKAQWQIERLKPLAAEGMLVFVDEPVLAAFGSSSYLYLSEEDVLAMLGEVFTAISEAGAITGIHVCGNSDWGVVVRSGVQVLNFDAYQYGASISLYPDEVATLFGRGGSIAWGIVPTTPVVNEETAEALTQRLESCFSAMVKKGFSPELLRERAIITPSCGAGSLQPREARRVFELLADVQRRMQT